MPQYTVLLLASQPFVISILNLHRWAVLNVITDPDFFTVCKQAGKAEELTYLQQKGQLLENLCRWAVQRKFTFVDSSL